MDIDILLALQNMREGAPGIITGLLWILSTLADGPGLVAIVMIVYWCVNKRAGQFTIVAFASGNLVSQFLKNLFCIYRPWIRDSRIVPPESVLEGSGGYSFPSGHTTGAVTSFGSFAWLLRRRNPVVSIVFVVIVALIMFARMYFGVHVPQDVIVGLAVGVLAIWLTIRFFRWFEENEDRDLFVVIVAVAVAVITAIIVAVKPFPLDYVDGVLLVDPAEMQKGSFEASGIIIGIAIGWLFERRMVQFSTDSADIDLRGRLIRGVVGVVIVGLVYLVGNALFKAIFGLLLGKLLAMAVLTFMAMFVVPFVFTWLEQTRFVPYSTVPAAGVRSSARSGRPSASRRSGGSSSRPSVRSGRASDSRGSRSSARSRSGRPSASRRSTSEMRSTRDGSARSSQDDIAQRSRDGAGQLPDDYDRYR